MNERIEKLGEEADLLGEFTPTKIPGRYVGYITEEQILKFAELIVRECLTIAKNKEDELENHNRLSESNAVGIVAYRIARQFGVKE